jgi:hypothetical protein
MHAHFMHNCTVNTQTGLHCHKSWRNISSPTDISELFHEHSITNVSEKASPLYVLVDAFPKVIRIFPNSHIPLYIYDSLLIKFYLLHIISKSANLVQWLRRSPIILKENGSTSSRKSFFGSWKTSEYSA